LIKTEPNNKSNKIERILNQIYNLNDRDDRRKKELRKSTILFEQLFS